MRAPDDDVKQALAQVAKLGGFQIKKMSTSDDMKDRVLTITLFRTSDGWVQERLAFEDEGPGLLATVDANGHVDKIETTDPSDLTETDETLGQADPDEGTLETLPAGDDTEKVGAATGEPRQGIQVEQGTVVELSGKKRR